MKRIMSKRFFAITAAAAFTLTTVSGAMAADTIKFGVAGPHSGDLASYG